MRREPQYLKWLRNQPCAVGGTCAGSIQACHVRRGTDGGMGLKPSDRFSLPMCAAHHGEQHMAGERTFEDRHGIDMKATAEAFYDEWKRKAA